MLLLRIAQGYSELALLERANGDDGAASAAQSQAIAAYRRARLDHPRDPRGDEALYGLGSELIASGDLQGGRVALLELIQGYPSSALVPHAYLAFGELFFDEAATDPSKLELARQSYLKALSLPSAPLELRAYASYRIGWIEMNLARYSEALASFMKAIEAAAAAQPATSQARRLADAARKDIVVVYARVGQPDRAYAFFARVSGDASGSHDGTVVMVGRLAQHYVDEGRADEALQVLDDLLRRHTDKAACGAARPSFDAIAALARSGPLGQRARALRARFEASCGTW